MCSAAPTPSRRTSAQARPSAPSAPTLVAACAAPVARTSLLAASVTTRARPRPPRSRRRRPLVDGGSVTRARRVRAPSPRTVRTPLAGAAPPITRAPSTPRCVGARPARMARRGSTRRGEASSCGRGRAAPARARRAANAAVATRSPNPNPNLHPSPSPSPNANPSPNPNPNRNPQP